MQSFLIAKMHTKPLKASNYIDGLCFVFLDDSS